MLRDEDDSSIAGAMGRHLPELWQGMDSPVVASNLGTQFALVRAGVGACVLSALAASHPSARGLPYHLIEPPRLQREVYVFTRRDVPLLPAAATFLKVLDEVLPGIDFVDGVQLGSLASQA